MVGPGGVFRTFIAADVVMKLIGLQRSLPIPFPLRSSTCLSIRLIGFPIFFILFKENRNLIDYELSLLSLDERPYRLFVLLCAREKFRQLKC